MCFGCTQSPIQELNSINLFTQRDKKLCALLQIFYIIGGAKKQRVCVHAGVCLCMYTHVYMRVGSIQAS